MFKTLKFTATYGNGCLFPTTISERGKCTLSASMATRQPRAFPPNVEPCSPGLICNITSSSASIADTYTHRRISKGKIRWDKVKRVKFFTSHMAHGETLISGLVALSPALAYTARPWTWG